MARGTEMRTKIERIGFTMMMLFAALPGKAQNTQQAPSTEQILAWLQHLAGEVRMIRVELTQLRLEAQEARIANLERELRDLAQKQTELQIQEKSNQHQLAEVTELNAQVLDPDQRAQVEALKDELTGTGADRLRTERSQVAKAEAELNERLRQEKAKQAHLQALTRQFASQAPAK